MARIITDAEMADLEKSAAPQGGQPQAAPAPQSFISDADMAKMEAPQAAAPQEEQSLPKQIGMGLLHGVGKLASGLDSIGGAPTRAAIGSMQEGKGLLEAAKSFGHQFGRNPEEAPTGKDIASRTGFSRNEDIDTHLPYIGKVSPAGLAGTAIDVMADPLNLVPVGKLAKGAKYALEAGARKLVGAGGKVAEGIERVTPTIGHALTGVPQRDIETYTKNLKELNGQIEKYGPELATASDDVREGFQKSIQSKRRQLNAQISETLREASPKRNIVIKKVIDTLKSEQEKLNPLFKQDQIDHIDELIKKANQVGENGAVIKKLEAKKAALGAGKADTSEVDAMIEAAKKAAETGKSSLSDLFDLKNHLQDIASGSYQKGGQIFIPGKEAQRAAKTAAAEARRILNDAAPEIAEANNQLSLMHRVQGDINKNILAPGKSDAALLGAGSVVGSRQRKNLERLDKIVGDDFVGKADKLAAYRSFNNPPLLPVDTTGKSRTRAALATGLGYLAGGPAAAAVTASFASPKALKIAINAGSISADTIRKLTGAVGEITEPVLQKAVEMAQTQNGKNLLKAGYMGSQGVNRNETNERRGLLR